MVDLRKLFTVLAVVTVLLIASVPASAQVTCFAQASNTIVRGEGLTELVGDIVLRCQGNPVSLPTTFRLISLNATITDRTNEARMLINDVDTGAVAGVFSPLVPNALDFNNVVFAAPATTGQVTLRITNVRMNATPYINAPTTALQAIITTVGTSAVVINNPVVTVATVQPGLAKFASTSGTVLQCNSSLPGEGKAPTSFVDESGTALSTANAATITFTQGFSAAFKVKIIGATQTVLGSNIYANSESGYVPTATDVAIATQGTRLMATFTNVPAGADVFVTKTNIGTSPFVASLVTGADANGASGTVTVTSTQDPTLVKITPTGTTATATWEIVNVTGTPASLDTVAFGVFLNFTAATGVPGLGQMKVAGTLAPLSTVVGPSDTAPVPRFSMNATPQNVFNVVACVTNLLFPFVTNMAGFETGIAISNTSLDTFGTPSQTGPCTITFFSGGAFLPAQTTSVDVKAGDTMAFLVGSGNSAVGLTGAPGFQGYMIATCNFQFAHGFAYLVAPAGAGAMGYLPLVINNGVFLPRSGDTPPPATGEALGF